MKISDKRGRDQRVMTIQKKAQNICMFASNILTCCRRSDVVLENVRRIRTQLDGIEKRAQQVKAYNASRAKIAATGE